MKKCPSNLLLLLSLLLGTNVNTKSIEGLPNEEADAHPNLVSFRISEDEQVVEFTWSDKRMALADLVKEDEVCIFNGKFNDDEYSRVLVTGCKGDERNIMIQISIGRNGLIEILISLTHG